MRERRLVARARVATSWLQERLPRAAPWVAIGALLLLQCGLFRQYALREVIWAYPTQFDQAAALRRSYETYEKIRSDGVVAGLGERLAQPAPTGVLMPIEGALLFLLIGPSRLSALTLNFLHFACLELVLVATLRWLSGRWSVACLGLGLLLAASAPWAVAGGLMDFRMDLIALCLFAVFISLVVRSRVFGEQGYAVAAGLAAAVLVMVRFITVVYLLGVFAVVLGFLLWRWRRGLVPASQLKGAVAALVMMLGVAGPAMAANLWSARRYYGVGHFTGIERQIRLEEQNLGTAAEYLLYYPRSLVRDQAGGLFLAVAGVALAAAAATAAATRTRPGGSPRDDAPTWVFLASCFLVPLGALSFHVVKSSVVASILVPALLWLTVFAVVWLTGAFRGRALPSVMARALTAIGALALLAGGYHQLDRLRRHEPLAAQRGDVEQLLALYDAIGAQSRARGWSAPRVSTDRLIEFLYPGLVPPVVYERQGQLLRYNGGLGGRIFAVGEAEALRVAEGSDFVVITDDGPDLTVYPFERSMRDIRPRLRSLCEQRFVRLGDYRFFGRQATLYVRPEAGADAMRPRPDSAAASPPAGARGRGVGPR